MSEAAAKFLSGIEGALQGLSQGISTDMHLRNIRASVKNGLYHAERTPEIEEAAGLLLLMTQNYEQQSSGMRAQYIEQMRISYRTLQELLLTAKPSAISSALGL